MPVEVDMPYAMACLLGALCLLCGCTGNQDECGCGDDDAGDDDVADDDAADDDTADDDVADDDVADDDSASDDDDEVWRPAPGTSWQIQYTGLPIDTSVDAEMFDLDLYDTPQEVFDELHAAGRTVICYFSAGSYEDWRPDAADFPPEALGNPLGGWPGEWWLDVTHPQVRTIMAARLDYAVARGCDGVDPDNVDGYTNNPGFSFGYAEQLDYNTFLADEAHARGLSVGLKNDLDQIGDLEPSFDFAVNEECFDYNECDALQPFVQAGKAVFQIQYGGEDQVDAICPQANARDLDTLIKNMQLDAWRIYCREQ